MQASAQLQLNSLAGDRPDPRHPERYARRVLVCVAGLSPATITETLYALVVPPSPAQTVAAPSVSNLPLSSPFDQMSRVLQGAPKDPARKAPSMRRPRMPPASWIAFVPTEIHLITTAKSKQNMISGLLDPSDAAPQGQMALLLAEYAAYFGDRKPTFGADQIHVITRDGQPLADIDSPEDSAATADTILQVLRQFEGDPDCAIHASIAGGRKSMSFLLGLCMTLIGRPQDRMSHVLVNEEFEIPGFFFPPIKPREIVGKSRRPISTAEARVTLAPLPMLRVFAGLGLKLLDPDIGFEGVIHLGELAIDKQLIRVIPSTCEVQLGDRRCKLTRGQMLFYLLLAIRRRDRHILDGDALRRAGGVRWVPGRETGFDGEAQRRARLHMLNGEDVKPTPSLRSVKSKINTALEEAFTPELARPALIHGPTDSKGDGIYGLFEADPEQLYIQ